MQTRSLRALLGLLVLSGCVTPTGRSAELTAAEHESAAVSDGSAGRQAPAAEHLAAARMLRDAEASACAGLTAAERGASPFPYGSVTSVVPLYPTQFRNAGTIPDRMLIGATIAIRAERGITAERLQSTISCRIAHARVEGESDPRDGPLALPGISAIVRSTGAGFAVEIAADDPANGRAEEILRRASRIIRP